MLPLLGRYLDDVLGPSLNNYLRLFQELDAHSTYHLLRHIQPPALNIRLWRSSHFSMLERPEVVIPAMQKFLGERAQFAAGGTDDGFLPNTSSQP